VIEHPRYCISILCFNRLEKTRQCLASVRVHSPEDTQIVVTDNGSSDGTGDYLAAIASEDPRVEYLNHGRNAGIAEGKVLALERCRAPWFVSSTTTLWSATTGSRSSARPSRHGSGSSAAPAPMAS
jgi:GT2 family glycosyltransferase